MGRTVPTSGNRGALASSDFLRASLAFLLVLVVLLLLAQLSFWLGRGERLFLVDSSRLESFDLPVWAPPFWKEEAQKALRGGSVFPVSDSQGLAEVEARIAALPFVEKVSPASRRFPRSIGAKVEMRRPVALVRTEGKLYAVDAHAVLLPGKPAEPGGGFAFPLPTLTSQRGVFPQLPSRLGEAWNDPSVREGVAAALELDPILDLRPGFRIVEIDLTNLGGLRNRLESEIALRTDRDVRILWGRSALSQPYGELAPEAKIANLVRVLEEYPGLKGVVELDLRFDRPAVRLAGK